MPQSQPINSSQTEGLSSQFQRRWEAGFAWTSACSAVQLLPGLRGFWPISAIQSNGDAFDQSGNGRLLTYNGNPTYNVMGLAPYIDLDGAGDYLSRADEAGLDILGTEAYIAPGIQGLTVGGWFNADTLGAGAGLIGKWTDAVQRAYLIMATNAATSFIVSGTGADQITATTGPLTTGLWYFLAGRFVPGANVDLFVNTVQVATAGAPPAAIFNSNAALEIGAHSGAGNYFHGQASLCFLCAAALSAAEIRVLYHKTKALYGVK